MMFAFLTMVTETDGKPANEYEHKEGTKPVYKKREAAACPCIKVCGSCYCCYALDQRAKRALCPCFNICGSCFCCLAQDQ